MPNTKILISGASVAGPALAYWLSRHGFRTTVVEIAPVLRGGGYAVDFRSAAHLTVLRRMGILAQLRAVQTGGQPWSFVDDTGRRLAGLPPEAAGGELEVTRGDLAKVLFEHTKSDTEYLFNDGIAALTETDDGVDVRFERGANRTFDLVIGADGLHSAVRGLAFGPEREFVSHLGFYLARWQVPNEFGVGQELVAYNEPGRMIGMVGDRWDSGKADAFGIFAAEAISYDHRNIRAQRDILAEAYAGMGWRAATLIEALADTTQLYFDPISRVDLPRWSSGRVALVGDAAHAATLGRNGRRVGDSGRVRAGRRTGRGLLRSPARLSPLRTAVARVRQRLPGRRSTHRRIPRPGQRGGHRGTQPDVQRPCRNGRHAGDGCRDRRRYRTEGLRAQFDARMIPDARPELTLGARHAHFTEYRSLAGRLVHDFLRD
ncbi:MAG TPA: FAD-dependent monooxygenase [Pseudonocardiaceae bacterium]|jgi:2-polyprenyl-6-methoxyphenol hydroxylase-like FAD-dependent oxidoreductase|nr:FAD-dependent monooxygenase [Pseudonocardiaceae bacterium]